MEQSNSNATAAGELTMESMATAMMDTSGPGALPPVSRKRSGRPALGGRGQDAWKALTACFLQDASAKTKNGLPGIPYRVKAVISGIRSVWSCHVSGNDSDEAPTSWSWMAEKQADIIRSIQSDVYCVSAEHYLASLAEACDWLGRRTSNTPIGEDVAPINLFTTHVVAEYKLAAKAVVTTPCSTNSAFRSNALVYEDLIGLRDHIRALRKQDTVNPDTLRLLGWGDVVLSVMVPPSLTDERNHAILADPELLNTMLVTTAPGEYTGQCAVLHHNTYSIGIPKLHKVFSIDDPESRAALAWGFAQRDGAKDVKRFLPRRLTVDTLLRRLCRGALKSVMKDKVLTLAHIQTVVVSEHFKDAMIALESSMTRLHCDELQNPLELARRAVYPSALAGVSRVTFLPLQSTSAETLVVDTGASAS